MQLPRPSSAGEVVGVVGENMAQRVKPAATLLRTIGFQPETFAAALGDSLAEANARSAELVARLVADGRRILDLGLDSNRPPEVRMRRSWYQSEARILEGYEHRETLSWPAGPRLGFHPDWTDEGLRGLRGRAGKDAGEELRSHFVDLDQAGAPIDSFQAKVKSEVAALFGLFPCVAAVPLRESMGLMDLVRLRAYPVHPIGLVEVPTWADGALLSPAEYAFHDIDHARYKIRADLAAVGIRIPDPYERGTTLDSSTGEHRAILKHVPDDVHDLLWAKVSGRRDFIRRLLQARETMNRPRQTAAEWMLFEVLHEKSHAPTFDDAGRQLANVRTQQRLAAKIRAGFFGPHGPPSETVRHLGDVGTLLAEGVA